MSLTTTLLTDPMVILETVATCLSGAYFLLLLNSYGTGISPGISARGFNASPNRTRRQSIAEMQFSSLQLSKMQLRSLTAESLVADTLITGARKSKSYGRKVRALSRRTLGANKNIRERRFHPYALSA